MALTTRAELHRLAWSEPIKRIAERYGTSQDALAKFLDREGIARPQRGHWNKVEAGHAVTPQPMLEGDGDRTVDIPARPHSPDRNSIELEQRNAVSAAINDARHCPIDMSSARDRHKVALRNLSAEQADETGRITARGSDLISVRVGPATLDRAETYIDALLAALGAAGIGLSPSGKGALIECAGTCWDLALDEQCVRIKLPHRHPHASWAHLVPQPIALRPGKNLVLREPSGQIYMRDEPGRPLEAQITRLIERLWLRTKRLKFDVIRSEHMRPVWAAQAEATARQQELERAERARQAKETERTMVRREAAEDALARFTKANLWREFARASGPPTTLEHESWLKEIEGYSDELDPYMDEVPPWASGN